jgi:hypothetical protein
VSEAESEAFTSCISPAEGDKVFLLKNLQPLSSSSLEDVQYVSYTNLSGKVTLDIRRGIRKEEKAGEKSSVAFSRLPPPLARLTALEKKRFWLMAEQVIRGSSASREGANQKIALLEGSLRLASHLRKKEDGLLPSALLALYPEGVRATPPFPFPRRGTGGEEGGSENWLLLTPYPFGVQEAG